MFCILRSTSNWGLLFVYYMLWVMLVSFSLRLVCLHLTDFFHHLLLWMLQWLQHLDKNVGIISGDPLLLLRFSPYSINTFRLVGLVLVGHCWPWLYLRGHGTHVLRCLWSWGHSLQGLLSIFLSFSQLPSGVTNLNVVSLFAIVGWATSCHAMAYWFWVRDSGLAWLQHTPSQLMRKLKPFR